MKEEWKDIEGYENYYIISNTGKIKSLLTNKLLALSDVNNMGYKRVTLYKPVKKRFFVHRLVAYHFCEGYSEDLVVNHKDGNKQNNHILIKIDKYICLFLLKLICLNYK